MRWRIQDVEILKACRDADPDCVSIVGESLVSFECSKAAKLLPIIKACKKGMGGCYSKLIDNQPADIRSTAEKALALLKKCE